MGIRGVWTLFRDLFHRIDPLDSDVKPLKIGIDMFSLIYTYRAQLHDLIHLLVLYIYGNNPSHDEQHWWKC